MQRSEDLTEGGFDPEGRLLCPDGNCIGIIGPDGRCKLCGAPAGAAVQAAPPLPTTEDTAAGGEADAGPKDEVEDEVEDIADRVLCRDEACIGVVGPDGRCKVCSLQAAS